MNGCRVSVCLECFGFSVVSVSVGKRFFSAVFFLFVGSEEANLVQAAAVKLSSTNQSIRDRE